MRRAYAYTLLIVLLWGASLVANKALLLAERGARTLTPLQVANWGIGIGWLTLLLVLALRGRLGFLRHIPARGWLVVAAMGFFGWAGYAVSLNYAFTRLPLPDAIIINYLHPVFVVLFQGPTFGAVVRPLTGWETRSDRRRPAPVWLALGLLFCLVGVAIIATDGHLASLGRIKSTTGALAALFAAFSWGAYSNLGRFVPVRAGSGAAAPAEVQSFLAMTFGLMMLTAAAAVSRAFVVPTGFRVLLYAGPWGPASVSAWVLFVVMGVLVYCGAYTLWLCALELGVQSGEAHKLPPITYLTPVVSVALGWLLLREAFGPAFWQGAALIAAGNAVNVRGRG